MCNNFDEFQNNYAELKQPDKKSTYDESICIKLYKMQMNS